MKKLIFLLSIISPLSLSAIDRSGALVSETWSENVHITANATIGNGVSIIILPGIRVEMDPAVNLIVSGTGILSAVGNQANPIYFTAYNGASWGHLVIQNGTATTNSEIKYCIIEKGTATSQGGGIIFLSPKLELANSTIQNNSAPTGGGIYIANVSPVIFNCKVTNNTATGPTGGGGLYFTGAASVSNIYNCIIDHNNSSNASGKGGGIAFSNSAGNIRFYNCVVASNLANTGANIHYTTNHLPHFINTIIWGSDNSIYNSPGDAGDFSFCAIQGYSSGYTSCFGLSSTNTDITGPNFTSPTISDYTINIASPCWNSGTDISGVPTIDISNLPRMLPYDIGAYELQWLRWKPTATSNDWSAAGNWDGGTPTSASNVYIPGVADNYPNPPNVATASDFTVGIGKELIIEPGAQVTFNSLTNNGTIRLKSDASKMFSLMIGSYDVTSTGTVQSEVFLTGSNSNGGNNWHYTAVPETMNKSALTSINNLFLLRYDDSRITAGGAKTDGWQWHDGWNGTTTDPGDAFSTLDIGRGYNFYHTNPSGVKAIFNSTSLLTTLDPLNGDGFVQYSGEDYDDNLFGWNLLGNSLTCGIDWDLTSFDGQTAIYFTKSDQVASYIDGDATNGATSFIPPLQGFFVKALYNPNGITFDGSYVHTSQSYFKGTSVPKPKVRLLIQQGNKKDETIVRFDDKASTIFDDKMDASKWLSANAIPQVYSEIVSEQYSINTLNFPEDKIDIPLGMVLAKDTIYKIKRTEILGLENYSISLKDNVENITINLNDIPEYSFSSLHGTINDRFILTVSNLSTGTEIIPATSKDFNVFQSDNLINLQTISENWEGKKGTVKLFDLTGRVLTDQNNIVFSKNSLVQIPVENANGMAIVEVRSGMLRFVKKVVIR